MNLIVIVCDTLRRDYLGLYGSDWVKTPRLDEFAAQAITFDKAFIGSFPTMPMRQELMTGKHTFHTIGWAPIPEGTTTFQHAAKAAGYVCAYVSDHMQQFCVPRMNYHQAFDEVTWIRGQLPDRYIDDPSIEVKVPCDPAKLRPPAETIEMFMRNISIRQSEEDCFSPQTMLAAARWLEKNHKEKFLLYIDTFDVHEPFWPPQEYVDLYDPGYEGDVVVYPRYDRAGYLTDAELRHVRALYAGAITLMDKYIGVLLDKVRELGLWDDTAICFISDHGWYFGEHGYIGKHTVLEPKQGWPFYNEVARIPLILHIPGVKEARRVSLLAQPVDVMPTLLEAVGADAPEGIHGVSLLSALRGGEPPRQLAVASPTLPEEPDVRAYATITDGRWTLIHAGALAPAELYDIDADPQQTRDARGEHPDVVERLHQDYIAYLDSIDTPEPRAALRRTYV